jgi:hypothetical protein
MHSLTLGKYHDLSDVNPIRRLVNKNCQLLLATRRIHRSLNFGAAPTGG